MQRCSSALVCACAVTSCLVTGCGSSPATVAASTTTTTTAVTSVLINGRWSFLPFVTAATGTVVSGTIPTVPGALFRGALTTNGTQVTGAGQISSVSTVSTTLACELPTAVTLHGTFNASRHLSLVSDPISGGGVLQMEVDVAADPHQMSTGMTTLTGPCATTGNIRGMLTEPINGTFSGSVLALDPTTKLQVTVGTADAVLSETLPDSTGHSVVSGQLTLHLSGCTVQVPVNESRIGDETGGSGFLRANPSANVAVSDVPDGTRADAVLIGLGQDCKPVTSSPPSDSILEVSMTKQ